MTTHKYVADDPLYHFGLNSPEIKNLQNGIITITGPINQGTAQWVINGLMFLEYEYPTRPVTLLINSEGGSVSDGLAIIDTCKRLTVPVKTIGTGMCASMAAVILICAAQKGERYITEHCEIMLHQPFGDVRGRAKDIEIANAHIQKTRTTLETLLSDASSNGAEIIRSLCNWDCWLSAQEALNLCLVDHVIEA